MNTYLFIGSTAGIIMAGLGIFYKLRSIYWERQFMRDLKNDEFSLEEFWRSVDKAWDMERESDNEVR